MSRIILSGTTGKEPKKEVEYANMAATYGPLEKPVIRLCFAGLGLINGYVNMHLAFGVLASPDTCPGHLEPSYHITTSNIKQSEFFDRSL